MHDLVQVGNEFAKNGGRLLLLSYDLQLPNATADVVIPKITAFLERRGFHGDCLVLQPTAIAKVEDLLALEGGIPSTIALDARGKVIARHSDAGERADFEALVAALRGKK